MSSYSFVKDAILNRKIGAYEVLTAIFLLELTLVIFSAGIFGSLFRVLLFGLLAATFYVAKVHFKGEFTLSELIKSATESKESKT